MDEGSISRVRSFSRTVTRRVGVLTDRFLGRDRPLAEARLIFEIGIAGCEVRDLRTLLGFDSGYLSRLLRSLERQGLVEVVPQAHDRRIRKALLTAAGHSELAELDQRGDGLARALLQPLTEPQRQRLTQAMSDVESLLRLASTTIERVDPSSPQARSCLEQYFAELDRRFAAGFELEKSISAAPEETLPPHGAFLLASLDGRALGCGVVKTLTPGVGTIKRMWVSETARGIGLGRRILSCLESEATELGMTKLRLETNGALLEAQNLYRSSGYRQVAAFNDDPYADFWFEKEISSDST